MRFRQAAVFVQIIADAAGKIQNARAMPCNQLLIAADGRGARRQPQHAVRLPKQLRGKKRRRRLTDLLCVIINVYLHDISLLCANLIDFALL